MSEHKTRKRVEPIDSTGLEELTVAVIGSVDSGKSTTIGTLVGGALDNGNGSARSIVFMHPHEHETGRTSDISYQYMKFNDKRVVTFVDLAGHEMYLKTTLSGLTSSSPDFAIVCISDKITKMTKEHMGLCVAMNIPFVVLFTKVDMVPTQVTNLLVGQTRYLLKSTQRKMFHIKEEKDIDVIRLQENNPNVPFMLTSNKAGTGLPLLKQMIASAPKRNRHVPNGFIVEHIYNVAGLGTILSGYTGSTISVGDTLYMGPFRKGEFIPVSVRSIHNDYRFDTQILPEKTKGCLAVGYKQKDNYHIKKGMILAKETPTNVCSEFDAKIKILHHHTTIKAGYHAYVNCGMLREPVKFVSMIDDDGKSVPSINSGDSVVVRMKFDRGLNYVECGQRLAFREGSVRGVGTVVNVYK